MKKLLSLIIAVLISGIFLSSCGKGMYITKRKYNRGFYVSRTHKAKTVDASENKNSASKQQISKTEELTSKTPGSENLKRGEVTDTRLLAQASIPATSGASASERHKVFHGVSAKQIKMLENIIPNKRITRELKQKLNGDRDALSLVWIIILVILLVYLIALLFDSFGLGWFINILLLIALILLILWLLRVV